MISALSANCDGPSCSGVVVTRSFGRVEAVGLKIIVVFVQYILELFEIRE
jgi:hypothetical protein